MLSRLISVLYSGEVMIVCKKIESKKTYFLIDRFVTHQWRTFLFMQNINNKILL